MAELSSAQETIVAGSRSAQAGIGTVRGHCGRFGMAGRSCDPSLNIRPVLTVTASASAVS